MSPLIPTIVLYTDSDVIGGAERSLLHLVEAYKGDAELVLMSTHDVVLDEAERRDLGVRRVRVEARASRWAAFADHRIALRLLRPDLLHVNLPNPFAARPAMLAAYSLGIPATATEHLVFPSNRRRGRLLKRVVSLPLAGTVAVGHASAAHLNRYFGISRRAITVVHNGIPDEPVTAIEFYRRPVIGCASRLEDQKQLDVLVAALAELPDTHLVLVGDGSQRTALEDLAADLGVAERVTFTGWLPDARPHIAGFDVFVLPSRREAFPLTIIEAMLAGTPVVATDVGSVTEAVRDGETGLVVSSGDVAALVQAVRRLLDDSALRTKLTTEARALAKARFTPASMAAGYDAVWTSALIGRRRRGRTKRA